MCIHCCSMTQRSPLGVLLRVYKWSSSAVPILSLAPITFDFFLSQLLGQPVTGQRPGATTISPWTEPKDKSNDEDSQTDHCSCHDYEDPFQAKTTATSSFTGWRETFKIKSEWRSCLVRHTHCRTHDNVGRVNEFLWLFKIVLAVLLYREKTIHAVSKKPLWGYVPQANSTSTSSTNQSFN